MIRNNIDTFQYNVCMFRKITLKDIDSGKIYTGMYTKSNIDKSTIPSGKFVYYCRHSDSDVNKIATIEPAVYINRHGMIVLDEKIEFPKRINELTKKQDNYINVKVVRQ